MLSEAEMLRRVNACYIELYKYSSPSVDFEELKKESTSERGLINIPFMEYEISKEKSSEIINSFLKGMSKFQKIQFSQTIHLGCSPKFKQEK